MMILIREGLGFNPDTVEYWTYEMVAPEDSGGEAAPEPQRNLESESSAPSAPSAPTGFETQSPSEEEASFNEESQEEGASQPSAEPAPQAEAPPKPPVATLTLHFISGQTLDITEPDVERVRKFFTMPSSQVTQL